MSTRASLRVFAGALVAGALLLVLQTATFRFVTVTWPFSAAFALDDLAIFVALFLLARGAPKARAALGFATLFAALAIFTDLPIDDASFSVVGLPFALGITLLSLLALHALAKRPGRRALTVLIVIAVGLAFFFRLAKMASGHSPLPLSVAWMSWSIEVLRPLLLAAFAWSVSREVELVASPFPASPYRGGATATRPEPLPDSTSAYVENADAALARYRNAVVVRTAALFAPVLVLIVAAMLNPTGRSAVAVIVALISLASLGGEVMLVASTSRLPRPLTKIAVDTRLFLTVANGALWLAIILDALSVLAGLVTADDGAAMFVITSYVGGAALSIVSVLSVARALAHVGERLGDERVGSLARLLLAECIAAGTLTLAASFVFLTGGRGAGFMVTALLVLGAGGIVVAGFVCTMLLLSASRAALRSAVPPSAG